MPAEKDPALSPGALTESAAALAAVGAGFADELDGPPTLAELLEVLGWSVPAGTDLPGRLTFRATLKGNRKYATEADSRVGGLNDAVFADATSALGTVLRALTAEGDEPVTPARLAEAVRQVLNTGEVALSDVAGADIRKVTVDAPKTRGVKAAIGDLVAIPVGEPGYRIGVLITRNRFGAALGLFDGVSATGRLTAALRAAPAGHPVYTGEELIKNGSWPVVGHDESLLGLFPADPEVFHQPGAWPGIDTGEHGAAETADGPLRLLDAAEAREVGLTDNTYRQSYPSPFLQKVLTKQAG